MKIKYEVKEEMKNINWDLIFSAVGGVEKIEFGITVLFEGSKKFWFLMGDFSHNEWNDKMDNQKIQNELHQLVFGTPAVFVNGQEHCDCQEMESSQKITVPPIGELPDNWTTDDDGATIWVTTSKEMLPYHIGVLKATLLRLNH